MGIAIFIVIFCDKTCIPEIKLAYDCRYVVEKDVENNVVFVSRNYFSLDKRRRVFRVGSLKWISGLPPEKNSQLQCKVTKMMDK